MNNTIEWAWKNMQKAARQVVSQQEQHQHWRKEALRECRRDAKGLFVAWRHKKSNTNADQQAQQLAENPMGQHGKAE